MFWIGWSEGHQHGENAKDREGEGGQSSYEECRQENTEGEGHDEDEIEDGQAENTDVAVICQQFSELNQPDSKLTVKQYLPKYSLNFHTVVPEIPMEPHESKCWGYILLLLSQSL